MTSRVRRPSSFVRFIGRVEEQNRLYEVLTNLSIDRGGVVWIEGGPGIGKSELLATVLRGTNWYGDIEEPDPFRAMLARLDRAAHLRRDLAAVAEAVRTFTSGVAAVRRVRLACHRPIVLILDDLHRADDASLEIWSQLHRLTRNVPLLLISTTRPVERPAVDAVHARAVGLGGMSIYLSPLADSEATELAREFGHDPYVISGAVRDAAGNPAYLRHLSNGRAVPSPDLRAVIADHLAGLTARTRQTLTLLAHTTPGATAIDLAARSGRSIDGLRADLHEAQQAAVLSGCGGIVTFRHPIVRRVLRLPQRERAGPAPV